MKKFILTAVAAALMAQSAGANAASKLAEISLANTLPKLTNFRLPIFGGFSFVDIPEVGSFLSQVPLGEVVFTITTAPDLLKSVKGEFLPLLTGVGGSPQEEHSLLSVLATSPQILKGGNKLPLNLADLKTLPASTKTLVVALAHPVDILKPENLPGVLLLTDALKR